MIFFGIQKYFPADENFADFLSKTEYGQKGSMYEQEQYEKARVST